MKKLILIFFIIEISKFGISQKAANEIKVFPIDESKTDSSISSFIKTLKNIALKKDTTSLFRIIDTNILTSYGGMQIGKRDFIRNWDLNNPDSSEVWNVITRLIRLGGVFDTVDEKRVFCLPYANAGRFINPIILANKDMEFDPYFTLICLKPKVPVFVKPDQKSLIVGYLSYDLVMNNFQATQKQNTLDGINWASISTFDSKIVGWVINDSFYSIGGWKIIIEKIDNEWRITKFFPFD